MRDLHASVGGIDERVSVAWDCHSFAPVVNDEIDLCLRRSDWEIGACPRDVNQSNMGSSHHDIHLGGVKRLLPRLVPESNSCRVILSSVDERHVDGLRRSARHDVFSQRCVGDDFFIVNVPAKVIDDASTDSPVNGVALRRDNVVDFDFEVTGAHVHGRDGHVWGDGRPSGL